MPFTRWLRVLRICNFPNFEYPILIEELYIVEGREIEVEVNHEHHTQLEHRVGEQGAVETQMSEELVAPGVPIVRGNTSRPLTFGTFASATDKAGTPAQTAPTGTSSFPVEAPVAPPVPEEGDDPINVVEFTPLPVASKQEASDTVANEFLWLFEYGTEMDIASLNSADRLDGLALYYGLAVLKGYQVVFEAIGSPDEQVAATLVHSREQEAEVWGVLYRIPRRMAERNGNEFSQLDKAHMPGYFEAIKVTVREAYRQRDLECLTYIATTAARQQFRHLPFERQIAAASSVKHLLESARKQKIPAEYLQSLVARIVPVGDDSTSTPVLAPPAEQNTEPLPVLLDSKATLSIASTRQSSEPVVPRNHWMMAFAIYLVLLVLGVFALAIVQGLGVGGALFRASFSPLGIPWFVLVYGLAGGCISSIVTLRRGVTLQLPGFVLLTWFTRPFIGALLAGLAYFLLNSGLFISSGDARQHEALFSLVGTLAGFCEGWLFSRPR